MYCIKGDSEYNFNVKSLDADISIQEYSRLPKNELYIILDNLRSAFNVGSIFRLCDSLRVAGLYLCGYTAHPPHKKLEKTSLGTLEFVPWRHFPETENAVRELQRNGIPVWSVETVTGAVPYTEASYPRALGLVFGNEALGVDKRVIQQCDQSVEIPLMGFKNSLNVAVSCGIVSYQFINTQGRVKPVNSTVPLEQ
ncbi:MAG: RNA methyltransferase [Chitinivibrionales bacterium]